MSECRAVEARNQGELKKPGSMVQGIEASSIEDHKCSEQRHSQVGASIGTNHDDVMQQVRTRFSTSEAKFGPQGELEWCVCTPRKKNVTASNSGGDS